MVLSVFLGIEPPRPSRNARLELEETTTEMFDFEILLLRHDNKRHLKLKIVTMIRNLSMESARLAMMALNQRRDVLLYVF